MNRWSRLRRWARGLLPGPDHGGPKNDAGPADATIRAARVRESFDPFAGPSPSEPDIELRLAIQTLAEAPTERAAIDAFTLLGKRGRLLLALDLAEGSLRRNPSARLALEVARALLDRGELEGAEQHLRPLLANASPDLGALSLAAELAEMRGRFEHARSYLERILARDVDYGGSRQALERLRGRERDEAPKGLEGATLPMEATLAAQRYRIDAELGRGGAGTVFRAIDQELGRRVALKLYHRRGRVERDRLQTETRSAAELEHPGVIRLFDVDPELLAIAMEWLPAGSLRRAIDRGRVSPDRALRWAKSAADALRFVHASGMIHRDIKPSNLLLRDDDRVVLTDFGIALPLGAEPRSRQAEGTLAYMPPEQRRADAAYPSADIFALTRTMQEVFNAAGLAKASSLSPFSRALSQTASDRPNLDEWLEGVVALQDETKTNHGMRAAQRTSSSDD